MQERGGAPKAPSAGLHRQLSDQGEANDAETGPRARCVLGALSRPIQGMTHPQLFVKVAGVWTAALLAEAEVAEPNFLKLREHKMAALDKILEEKK